MEGIIESPEMVANLLSEVGEFFAFDPTQLGQPSIILRILLQVLFLFGSSYFSGSETALFSLSDVDLEQLRKKHHPRSDLLHDLLSQPRRLIISILCGNELINIAATANMAGILMALYGPERAGIISVLIMVPLLLLFGEITPKTIAVTYPMQVSTRIVSGPMAIWVQFITPVRWLIRLVADRVTTLIVGEARDADHILRMSEFRSLVAEIEEEGLLDATDRVLVYNLLDASNTEVIHIMTPRTRIEFIREDWTLHEIMDEFMEKRRLRMPVYRDSRDNVIGFIHAEDLLERARDRNTPGDLTAKDILRPALHVPSTKSVDEMLDFFQAQDARAAMILNEFGGISGMATLEDVLNFIFGEIAGDFVSERSYTEEDEQTFVVLGEMTLNDFEALTNFGVQDPRLTTIGGVALRHFGRVPQEGDQVIMEGLTMTVLEMEGNRIVRLRVSKAGAGEKETVERQNAAGEKERGRE